METPQEKFLEVSEPSFKKVLTALVSLLSLTISPINPNLSDKSLKNQSYAVTEPFVFGFASGVFECEHTEDGVGALILAVGNDQGMLDGGAPPPPMGKNAKSIKVEQIKFHRKHAIKF